MDYAFFNPDGSVTAGPIDGQQWAGITEGSVFWPLVEEWVAEGNVISQPVAPPSGAVFAPLTPRQLRLGLWSIGIDEQAVEQAIADLPDASFAMIEWRHAGTYDRTHPLVGALGQTFDLPVEQIDALWTWAAGL
ncbi:hypothetical protein AAIH46_17890 [Rhizobium sp. 0TCS1.26]|uniref:hypothetical protein n=1 Tax=Rhizobium sp. 0TCS1.26 TaxID=3142623 RepID=UPI003D277310